MLISMNLIEEYVKALSDRQDPDYQDSNPVSPSQFQEIQHMVQPSFGSYLLESLGSGRSDKRLYIAPS